MEKPVIIFGAGPLGRATLEIFESNKVITYCFLDDDTSLRGKEIDHVAVMGSMDDEAILSRIGKKCEVFIAIDENRIKKSMTRKVVEELKVMPVNAIHERAYISFSATLGHGNFINAGTAIGTGAVIGSHCILNSNVVVDHTAVLGDYVQVGAGSVINSGADIGNEVFIGSGVTIISGIRVGKGARIGAGSVVVSHVEAGSTVFGNPAKKVEK